MVQEGADSEAQGRQGETELHVAAHLGHAEPVDLLLAARASHTIKSKKGLQPLHHAAFSCSVPAIQHLLSAGASLDVVAAGPGVGKPLDIATRVQSKANGAAWQRVYAAVKLLEGETRRRQKWFRAVRGTDIYTMRELLAAGLPPDVCQRGAPGETAMEFVVVNCQNWPSCVDAAALLVEFGADINLRSTWGRTPLHALAVRAVLLSGDLHPDIRDRLLELVAGMLSAGAHADVRDWRGQTPADCLGDHVSGRPNARAVHTALVRACRLRLHLRRWRVIVRTFLLLRAWHARAVERAYAPGGGGYAEVAADFAERAAKVQRAS